jgi:hypothetical protein
MPLNCSRKNQDVVIKVVAQAKEGLAELQILRILNSEPLKSDPFNTTVPVLEFLTYEDWHFAVMPFFDPFDVSPFLTASECLDFAEQALSVSGDMKDKLSLLTDPILGFVFFAS